jgi:hypothetical protein
LRNYYAALVGAARLKAYPFEPVTAIKRLAGQIAPAGTKLITVSSFDLLFSKDARVNGGELAVDLLVETVQTVRIPSLPHGSAAVHCGPPGAAGER